MDDKKEFVENDLQSILKKADSRIDKVFYEANHYYDNEAVIVFYKNGQKKVIDVTGNNKTTIIYNVARNTYSTMR